MPESPQSLFDALAQDYESMRRELKWDPFVHIREAFHDMSLKDLDILDAGCGTGECTRWLAQQGAKPYGIDISDEMCFIAADRSENIPYLAHDLSEPLPFGNARFDAVIALGCLEYIENIEATVAEFARVLKPDGLFLGCFERYGDDCPGKNEKNVVFFDEWMRFRQSETEIRQMHEKYFKSFEITPVRGFLLEETNEYTQYLRVIAKGLRQ